MIDGPLKGAAYEYAVARDASVEIRSKPVKLADLPVGTEVDLNLSVDWKTARGIYEGGPREIVGMQWGDVKAVNARAKTVTVTNEEGDQTLTAPEEARVILDGKAVKLADLASGMEVVVRTRGRTVSSIVARL